MWLKAAAHVFYSLAVGAVRADRTRDYTSYGVVDMYVGGKVCTCPNQTSPGIGIHRTAPPVYLAIQYMYAPSYTLLALS